MQREYPHVSNDMSREVMTVYGYENRDDLRLPTRLQYLSLDLPTFIAYLRDMQDWLKGNPYGEVLTMGPSTRWVWVFKNFIEIQLDGWLENTVGVGQEAVKIGGNYYALPRDLKTFWKQLEDLQENLPLNTILETMIPAQKEEVK
jgi:hypothetical protein